MDYRKTNAPVTTVTRDMMELCEDTGNENREQIEISRYYEKLPKPTLIATQEYLEGKVYYRNPSKEKEKLQ